MARPVTASLFFPLSSRLSRATVEPIQHEGEEASRARPTGIRSNRVVTRGGAHAIASARGAHTIFSQFSGVCSKTLPIAADT
jgi:hypothetical protein